MEQTLTVVFDSQVLRLERPLDLEPDVRHEITLREKHASKDKDVWEVLESRVGSAGAPSNWIEEHDHDLSGMPKRSSVNVCNERRFLHGVIETKSPRFCSGSFIFLVRRIETL
jgi:hypothetical protein